MHVIIRGVKMQLHKDMEGKMYYLKDRKRVYTKKTPLKGNVTKSRSRSLSTKPDRTMKRSPGRPRNRSPSSKLYGRVRKSKDNPCSLRNRNNCSDDPSCHYVKKKGCIRRPSYRKKLTSKGNTRKYKLKYEGPTRPVDYMNTDNMLRESDY
jgi:hypothetical protein